MQHPVGYQFNPEHRPRRADRLLGGADQQGRSSSTFPHVDRRGLHDRAARSCSASRPGIYVARQHADDRRCTARRIRHRRRRSRWSPALGVAVTGDLQGKVMTEVQPMKMAAAEALYDDRAAGAPFSLFTIGTPGRHRGEVLDHRSRACCRSWPPAPSTARSRASTTCARSTSETYGQDPGARTTRRRLHADHPGDLLDVPAA